MTYSLKQANDLAWFYGCLLRGMDTGHIKANDLVYLPITL